MKVVAVIPARYASRRLPGKPLAMLAGKPMIRHVYERAAQAQGVSRVLVATDDERILDAVAAFGGAGIMTPSELHSGTDRVAYVARTLDDADIIVNVQGDEPLIEPAMITEGVNVVTGGAAPVGTLVKRITDEADLFDPNTVKVVLSQTNTCLYFSRSPIPFDRDTERGKWLSMHTYYKHIGMYIFRREFLDTYTALPQTPLEVAEKLEQLRILEHGFTIAAAVTHYDTVPVDTPADLERVRRVLEAQ